MGKLVSAGDDRTIDSRMISRPESGIGDAGSMPLEINGDQRT
ncbi:MAG: hypothetical protein OSA40_11740 [Phycisphaerales bacterium]|nr:hypothetical protein [Phycisphaerales bacterium]